MIQQLAMHELHELKDLAQIAQPSAHDTILVVDVPAQTCGSRAAKSPHNAQNGHRTAATGA